MVERLFLAVLLGCLQFVIVVFPDLTHSLFLWTPVGKGLACVRCFIVFCHFPILCPGSGVVLDCIES